MDRVIEKITSKQNEKIKNLIKLQKSGERRKQSAFFIEGLKEIERAIISGYQPVSIFYCPEIIHIDSVDKVMGGLQYPAIYQITHDIYNKVAYRENSGGLIVVAKSKDHRLENLTVGKKPLFLVIEGLEKPGNIGAILRTADAAGVTGVIVCEPATDLYNPNTIRSSLGCLFTQSIALCTSIEAVEWLIGKGIQIVTTHLQAVKSYFEMDYTLPTAIVMGTEATGITRIWENTRSSNVIIPMSGVADSLNVSTATAIIVFEALRQRLSM